MVGIIDVYCHLPNFKYINSILAAIIMPEKITIRYSDFLGFSIHLKFLFFKDTIINILRIINISVNEELIRCTYLGVSDKWKYKNDCENSQIVFKIKLINPSVITLLTSFITG